MKIIEEQVQLGSATFTKTELQEISSLTSLDKDGINYVIDTTRTIEVEKKGITREMPIAYMVRKSKAMQKALRAGLIDAPHMGRVIIKADLKRAILLYRK